MKIVATEVNVFYPKKYGKVPLYIFRMPFAGNLASVFSTYSEHELGIFEIGETKEVKAIPYIADIFSYLLELGETQISVSDDYQSIICQSTGGHFILSHFGGMYRFELDSPDSPVTVIVAKVQAFIESVLKESYITEARVQLESDPNEFAKADMTDRPLVSTKEESEEVENHAGDEEPAPEVSEISSEIKKGVDEILNKTYE